MRGPKCTVGGLVPITSPYKKRKLDRRKIRPIGEHCCPVCIIVMYRGRSIPVLIDSGSDLTIAGSAFAKKHHWKIQPAELQSVKMANGQQMLIEGVATVKLKANGTSDMRYT